MKKFNNVLAATKENLNPIVLGTNNSSQSRFTENTGVYYLEFPEEVSPDIITEFSSDVTIQSLSSVLADYGVSIDDSLNSNADLTIQVSEQPIRAALEPLVIEAKNYLMTKGATNQQIMDMLQEEGAEEIDLIPFVKALVAIEQGQLSVVRTITLPFVSEVNARNKFLDCGAAALGADALYALSQSAASSWTWPAMKLAFKTVAKKMLGPIGVAVAVVSFGICMLG